MHLSGVGVFHRRHDEAGSAQRDLTLGPAVHRQSQLPFPHVEHPGQLHALGTPHAARLTCGGRRAARYVVKDNCSQDVRTSDRFIFSSVGLCESAPSLWVSLSQRQSCVVM